VSHLGLALLLAFAACAAGPYESYRAAHPEWNGEFPSADADLVRTLAALHAQGRGTTVTVTDVKTWRRESGAWVTFNPVLAPPDGEYAVVASLHCASNDGTTQFVRSQNVWYLLPNDKLAAWDHYAFQPGCEVTNAFEPARGALVADERELLQRVGLPLPAGATSDAEFYQKGRAFLRAGRRDEAREMLARGDSAGKGGFDVRARFNGPHAAPPESAADARAALTRELDAAP
jgi:hypothetical protein